MDCPKGQIKRSSYKRSGLLSNYGYSVKRNAHERKTSLKRAMSNEKPLEVLQHLNAIRTLNKSRREVYNKMDSDVKFLQKEYKRISKKTSKRKGNKKNI